ncbi:MAG TPA: APC family permease [Roseiflexaceae bacterium]|nr:APC family permease [Roseiflexaceae bacterium]
MSDQTRAYMTIRQAAFIGVGAMVGAGIFSLLGAAGEVAGAAVWLSFVLAGCIAGLQGYSFAKLGAKYPSAGGLLEYVAQGFGPGHTTRVTAWLTYAVNAVITAMVASSFGSYASAAFAEGSATWTKIFAALIIVAMTVVNIVGSQVVARAQTVIVSVVIGSLSVFAVATLLNINPQLLAPSGYPPLRDIVASVALTFFAFLGFGIVTFTAKDLKDPSRELPKAMYLALGIAAVVYVAVSLGVFGTLTVEQVIASGGTAIAVAAEPILGQAGYWMMSLVALFATSGATNAGLYPAQGLCDQLVETKQFPPIMARRLAGRASAGLIIVSLVCIVLVAGFDVNAIASIGSAVALAVFGLVTVAHFRVREVTGANVGVLVLALATIAIALLAFVFTELIYEPASMLALLVILLLSIGLDFAWTRARDSSSNSEAGMPAPPIP